MGERRERWRKALEAQEVEAVAPELKALSDAGDADALLFMGVVLQNCGIEEAAANFYQKSANGGSALGMYMLGRYFLGRETDTNLLQDAACTGRLTGDGSMALMWFEKAEEVLAQEGRAAWDDEKEARFGVKYLRACILIASPEVVGNAELALAEAYSELEALQALAAEGILSLTPAQAGMVQTRRRQCCAALATSASSEAERASFAREAEEAQEPAPAPTQPQPPSADNSAAPAVEPAPPTPALPVAPPAPAPRAEEVEDDVISIPAEPAAAPTLPGARPAVALLVPAPTAAPPAPPPQQHFALPEQHVHVQQAGGDGEVLALLRQQQQDINILKAVVERQSHEMAELREQVAGLEAGAGRGAAEQGGLGFKAALLPPHAYVAADGRTFFCRKGSPGTCAVAGLPLRAADITTFSFTVDVKDGCWGVILGVVPKSVLRGGSAAAVSALKPGSMPQSWAVDNCKKLICQTYSHKTHPTSWGSSWIKAGCTIQCVWNGPQRTIYFARTSPKELGAKAGFGFHNLPLDPEKEWVPAVWAEASFCDVSVTLAA